MVGQIVIFMEESNDFGIPYCNIGKSQSTPFGLAMSILPNFRPKIVIMMGKTKVWVIIYEFNIAQMGCKHCSQRDEQLAQLQLEEPGLVFGELSLLFVQLISQVSSCGEQRQELVGEALSALLEVDGEDDGGTRMVSKAKETFGAACLPLPGELRFAFCFVCLMTACLLYDCCLFAVNLLFVYLNACLFDYLLVGFFIYLLICLFVY